MLIFDVSVVEIETRPQLWFEKVVSRTDCCALSAFSLSLFSSNLIISSSCSWVSILATLLFSYRSSPHTASAYIIIAKLDEKMQVSHLFLSFLRSIQLTVSHLLVCSPKGCAKCFYSTKTCTLLKSFLSTGRKRKSRGIEILEIVKLIT